MRRRDLVILLVVGGWPFAARAQQKAMPVIGYLHPNLYDPASPDVTAFHQGLSETGYVEGQNLAIEYRSAAGQYDRLPALAVALVGRKVDVIVAIGGASVMAAKSATSTIPIVFVGVGDPVASGLVASLAHPAGNLTGFSNMTIELHPKRLQLLSELVPQAMIAMLVNPNNPSAEQTIRDVQETARAKALQVHILKAGTESEIDAAFPMLVQLHAALVVGADAFFFNRRKQLLALTSRHAVPAIYVSRVFVADGGLISYGISTIPIFRQAGIYVGKILNGAKAADLPVQQPTTFELVVNMKTATALGLTVPPSILARADEVIE